MQKKSIKRNSVYNILKTGSAILFPLITFPYISRVLMADNVGKINFGISIVNYFSLIASLGIFTYAVRECSGVRDNKERLSVTASQIFSINVITTMISYAGLAFTLVFYHKLDNYRPLIIVQSLTILAATIGADWLNSAMEDFRYITIRTVVFQIISLMLMFVFVRKPGDYMKYALISLVSSAGANITNIWYRRRYCRVCFTTDIEWKKHLSPILLLFVMILAQTIYHNVDSTMLGILRSDREVGIYSAAHKIFNIINQVVASLIWVIMPRMSLYFKQERYDEINSLLRKILGYNLLIGLPCAVGTVVLSEDIIRIVAGKDFLDAVPVLWLLMIGFVFMLLGGNFLGNAVMLPSKQEKYYMVVCCATMLVNATANYILIPLWGAVGAAATTALSELISLILLMIKRDLGIHIKKAGKLLASPLCGCCAIVLLCLCFSKITSLWIRTVTSICISIIVYVAIQVMLRNELVLEMLVSVKKNLQEGEMNEYNSCSNTQTNENKE